MAQPIGGLVELANGLQVRVRPIRTSDAPMIAEGFERLDAESRRLRFFSPTPRLSSSLLRWMVDVDHDDHEALVAVMADAPDSVVGVARYIRRKDRPADAEVAVTVCQHLRRQGLGTALLRHLRRAALANGIERFTGEVMPENRAALRWLAAGGAAFDFSEPRATSFAFPLRRFTRPDTAAS